MKNRKLKVIELFSGIGSQAKALRNIGADFEVVHTCEWNLHSVAAYESIHCGQDNDFNVDMSKEELIDILFDLGLSNDGKKPITKKALQSITEEGLKKIYKSIINTKNLVDISKIKGEDIPRGIDIMTYSFPCQDLSNVGALHGYNKGIDRDAHNRSGLLWEVERILLERKEMGMDMPHFLLMENVPSLNSQRHRENFEEWKNQLVGLGYHNAQYVLNASNFGLPQNRNRLFMISVYTGKDSETERVVANYLENHNLESSDYIQSLNIVNKNLKDILKTDYSNEIYLKEALLCQPNATDSRKTIWEENLQITDTEGNIIVDNVATLTTKQDRHPNSGNLWVDFKNGKSNFRYLTPRECFVLMGFDEEDYNKVVSHNFLLKKNSKIYTRDILIKMAGNSIAVDVLTQIFKEIVELGSYLYM